MRINKNYAFLLTTVSKGKHQVKVETAEGDRREGNGKLEVLIIN